MSPPLLRAARAWFGLGSSAASGEHATRVFPSTIQIRPRPVYDAVTRTYNFLGALLGLLILSPLMIGIALAVKLTSPGPALYRGDRVGLGQKTFHIFKFRTMKVGSEQKIGKRLVQQDEDHYTPIGKFLRKYRLDELAQLLNVLRGDMNLVGPRPLRPIFLQDLLAKIPGYDRRYLVRPGITGQAQVRGGYYTTPRHKLFYDVLYIARRSVIMDLQLITLTFLRVMTRIFTAAVLLSWLVLLAVALPNDVHQAMRVSIFGLSVNLLYLGPPTIAGIHLLRREVNRERIYALRTPVDLPLLGFVVISAALLLATRFPVDSLRGLLWWVCNGVVVFYLVLNSRMVTTRRGLLTGTLVGSVALTGTVTVLQAIGGFAAEGRFVQAEGTQDSPLLMASLVTLALPLALSQFRRAQGRVRVLASVAIALLIATAAVTLSRSGMLATAIAVALFAGAQRRALVLAATATAILVAGLALGGDARLSPKQTTHDLVQLVEVQTDMLREFTPTRLAIGAGPRAGWRHFHVGRIHARRADRGDEPNFENTYLRVLVDHGPLGLLFFLAFFAGGLAYMWRNVRALTDRAAAADLRATAAGLTGWALLMLFSDMTARFSTMVLFFASMGLGLGIVLTHRAGPRAVYRLVHYRHRL
ncbi:MAG: sugar transferase [Myxococcales bacterium]|nr:sugar transferase [Myxococcales bacterium]